MVMVSKTKNDCAGKDQQQILLPCPHAPGPSSIVSQQGQEPLSTEAVTEISTVRSHNQAMISEDKAD
jgi:hypothetical protein